MHAQTAAGKPLGAKAEHIRAAALGLGVCTSAFIELRIKTMT